jgi:hypothetical protein
MSHFLSLAMELHRDNNRGYGPLPIPQPRDNEISNLLRRWMALDDTSREQSALQVGDEHLFVLLAYSERMATRAVREGNQDLVLLGLIALGLDDWRIDFRENMLIVPLHLDAAERIGAVPAALFEHAASFLPRTSAQGLRDFLKRSGRDKSLAVMGYVVGKDGDGFRYQRTW